MLKRFTELTPVNRCEPCQEYPGVWYVYVDGNEVYGSRDFDDAFAVANKKVDEYEYVERWQPLKVSISWCCSEDDPRVGEVWFTGFYQHGKFNNFGQYIS